MSGRRSFFYSYDVTTGAVTRVPRILGREEKSLERWCLPCAGPVLGLCWACAVPCAVPCALWPVLCPVACAGACAVSCALWPVLCPVACAVPCIVCWGVFWGCAGFFAEFPSVDPPSPPFITLLRLWEGLRRTPTGRTLRSSNLNPPPWPLHPPRFEVNPNGQNVAFFGKDGYIILVDGKTKEVGLGLLLSPAVFVVL